MGQPRWFEPVLAVLIIVLACLLYILMVSTPPSEARWEKSDSGYIDHMMIGGDDTLYTFSGNTISAINRDGSLRWELAVPEKWKVLNNWSINWYRVPNGWWGNGLASYPVVDEQDGHLYL